VTDRFPGTRQTVADVLLAVHRSYLKPVKALMRKVTVRGMAHITGGGFPDNIERIPPRDVAAVVDRSTWKVPALFRFIQQEGRVDRDEMYRVFQHGDRDGDLHPAQRPRKLAPGPEGRRRAACRHRPRREGPPRRTLIG